jgi:hypothetical protein
MGGVLDVGQESEIVFALTDRDVLSADCPFNVAWPSASTVTALAVEQDPSTHAPPLEENEIK